MAKYRRFVAYVYEYQKGRKGRNCGFIRVEAWEERCRMEVHLLCPGLLPDVRCEVLGFVRNAGLMDGRLIGTCRTKESRADCIIETERNSLGGSGVSLDAIGGMILTTENGGFFGTEWDDQPVRPENFRRIELEKETGVPEQKRKESSQNREKEQKSGGENSGECVLKDTKEEPEERKEEPLEKAGESQGEETEIQKEDPEEERQEIQTEETEEAQQKIQEEEPEEGQKEVQKQEEKEMQSEEVSVKEVEETERPEETEIFFGEVWDPFGDGEVLDCRKIQPGDFRYFHPRDCALRNNRFLQYGFYSFGHLLVGKLKTGGYILGVPGGYDQQERFMANMFGFPYFKRSGQIRLPQNKGGYWYRLINPPKLC